MSEIEPTFILTDRSLRDRWMVGHTVIDRLIDKDLTAEGLDADAYFFAEVRREASHARLDNMLGVAGVDWNERAVIARSLAGYDQEASIENQADRLARRARAQFKLITGPKPADED